MKFRSCEAVLQSLVDKHKPFQNFPPEKYHQIADAIRVIELYPNEEFMLRPTGINDYLILMEGHALIDLSNGDATPLPMTEFQAKPILIPDARGPFRISASMYSVVCHIDRQKLDQLISLDELICDNADMDISMLSIWHDSMLKNCALLRRLPMEKVESVFSRMTIKKVNAGDEIIRQGEHGDAFYIIQEGTAEVWRTGLFDDVPRHTDDLGAGDTCGNQALLTGQTHPKSVRMKTDGVLLVLSHQDFDAYVRNELIRTVNSDIAKVMIDHGYKLLDVRYEEEYAENRIPGAILIPLHELRKRVSELDTNSRYVIYCHSGTRSLVAAMRLAQNNIESFSLDGGLRDWPYATEGEYSQSRERRQRAVCRRGINIPSAKNCS